MPQVHALFSRLLCNPPPSPARIAELVTSVLRRNEEARIYHWHKATGRYPPRRRAVDTG